MQMLGEATIVSFGSFSISGHMDPPNCLYYEAQKDNTFWAYGPCKRSLPWVVVNALPCHDMPMVPFIKGAQQSTLGI